MRSVWRLMLLVSFLLTLLAPTLAEQRDSKEEWISLFNGTDLAGWKLRNPSGPNGWKVVDGVYVNTPPSTDILTEREFDDFDLYVEIKPAETTNSGLYLRDIYEVQILNSYGKPTSDSMCGSLYRRIAPTVNACRPAGEWQDRKSVV